MLGVCTVGMAFLPGYKDAGTTAIVALLIHCVWAKGWHWVGRGTACHRCWPCRPQGAPGLVRHDRPVGRAALGFVLAAGLFAYLYSSLTVQEFLAWGWRYPFLLPLR